MPRRSVMTPAECAGLFAFPNTDDAFVRYYTFSESDLAAIRQRRGKHNRLGFAVQLERGKFRPLWAPGNNCAGVLLTRCL